MDNTWEMESLEKRAEVSRVLKEMAKEKDKLALLGCLLLGMVLGGVTRCVYGGANAWSGVVTAYCSGFWWALLEIAPVTLGFVAALFALAPFRATRLLIAPAVCFRGMGIGALICGVIQAEGLMGLCFAALVLLPYVLLNGWLSVRAGEFSLGLRTSLRQPNAGLQRSVMRHTLGVFALCLLTAAFSCGLFALSCAGFGKYLL